MTDDRFPKFLRKDDFEKGATITTPTSGGKVVTVDSSKVLYLDTLSDVDNPKDDQKFNGNGLTQSGKCFDGKLIIYELGPKG